MAFKLLMAIYDRLGIQSEENTLKYLDLVAVGTIADIVPLTGENRVFASIGLQHLIDKKNLGLNALIQISGLNQKTLDTNDIVFGIAPASKRQGGWALWLWSCYFPGRNHEEGGIHKAQFLRQQLDQRIPRDTRSRQEVEYDHHLCMVSPRMIGIGVME